LVADDDNETGAEAVLAQTTDFAFADDPEAGATLPDGKASKKKRSAKREKHKKADARSRDIEESEDVVADLLSGHGTPFSSPEKTAKSTKGKGSSKRVTPTSSKVSRVSSINSNTTAFID